jgi:hypothetical protein
MKVTEEQRRALFERVRDHLDEDTANLLLEVTVPANVDLATRGDIQELRAEMLWSFSQLDGRLSGQMTELDGRLSAQITELDRRMTSLDGRLTAQITALDGRLTKQMTGLDGRLTDLEVRIDKVGTDLARKLYVVVIPVLSGVTLVLVGLATWIGILVG